MAHRILRGPRVEIDGVPLAPHADDVLQFVSSTSYGDFLGYRGPDESAVRRALVAADAPFSLRIVGDEPQVVTAVPVGVRDGAPGQTLLFRLQRG